jgi:hypothetical protein
MTQLRASGSGRLTAAPPGSGETMGILVISAIPSESVDQVEVGICGKHERPGPSRERRHYKFCERNVVPAACEHASKGRDVVPVFSISSPTLA